ncbi:MAG TPA: hypothetical protein VMZ00_02305 [Sporichthya sp.]|nr:hypothetical protein [Sporichthya sp.]
MTFRLSALGKPLAMFLQPALPTPPGGAGPAAAATVPVPAAGARERTLLRYLVLPRPKDLVKAVVLPLGFVLGVVADGGTSTGELARASLVWAALELLVYQARYQWNDARGFAADQRHPDHIARGRLPGPIERGRSHIAASLGVAALRLGLVAVLALAVPQIGAVLVAATLGVFGAALVYERVRTAATGRAAFPVPLRPALIGLWLMIGAGYAVRGLTGLALAVDLGGRPGLIATAAAAMWALGVVFCTSRWVLEAMCYARVVDGRVVWRVRPDHAREHLLGLVRWLPAEVPPGTAPRSWRALRARTPVTAPWNLALIVAGATAALAGRLLVGPEGAAGSLAVAAAGALSALGLAVGIRRRNVAALAGAALMFAGLAITGTDRPGAALLPWAVVAIAHRCFCGQCADDIGHPARRLTMLRRA